MAVHHFPQYHMPSTTGPPGVETLPDVRRIRPADLGDALARGLDDFNAKPSHVIFLCLIYPLAGILLARLAFGYDMLPLLFPLVAGFALLGPVAAIGFYELSRRRERGQDLKWKHAFNVLWRPRAIGALLAAGALLMALFVLWLAAAHSIYVASFGDETPGSVESFVSQIFTTSAGERLIAVGVFVGFLFAAAALAISVVTFPLILDRETSAAAAIVTSLKACWLNPLPMALWGLIVAGLLVVGFVPLMIGLVVALPVLGHATWHLYRKLVV